MLLAAGFLAIVFTIVMLSSLRDRFSPEDRSWPAYSSTEPPTLVYRREDLQRIWEWEVAAGHYPSGQKGACFLCSPCARPNSVTSSREHWPDGPSDQSRAAPKEVVAPSLAIPPAVGDEHARYWR